MGINLRKFIGTSGSVDTKYQVFKLSVNQFPSEPFRRQHDIKLSLNCKKFSIISIENE